MSANINRLLSLIAGLGTNPTLTQAYNALNIDPNSPNALTDLLAILGDHGLSSLKVNSQKNLLERKRFSLERDKVILFLVGGFLTLVAAILLGDDASARETYLLVTVSFFAAYGGLRGVGNPKISQHKVIANLTNTLGIPAGLVRGIAAIFVLLFLVLWDIIEGGLTTEERLRLFSIVLELAGLSVPAIMSSRKR